MTELRVNGRSLAFDADDAMPLLWALRDAANLTGTKYGCGTGECGTCTVLIDGEAARSCQIPLGDCTGRAVTTIEGLPADRSHAVQRAFLAENVTQCGYCNAGLIMAIIALLSRNPEPDDAEIDRTITNICRCGIYPRLRKAIHRAGAMMRSSGTLSQEGSIAAP